MEKIDYKAKWESFVVKGHLVEADAELSAFLQNLTECMELLEAAEAFVQTLRANQGELGEQLRATQELAGERLSEINRLKAELERIRSASGPVN